ncbi:hypothetical protein [Mycolicibacterium sediminis]|uniref:Uncharacterized protein n=1 Tax=Mycolicibacterium sediminis TaxID=1286180 RepID=A0A7I7QWA0_9MYCO|nr:hypothetical protein [Mycolicibacterium sediminis]BBY30659.1 hypothetical protein MSEDJ_47550 [Mycolicibacterium sediminis]
MGAREVFEQRRIAATMATGVVVSMTALVAGVAPALAQPGTGPSGPTTTVAVPEPAAEPTEQPTAVREAPAAPPVTQAPVEAPVTQAPVTQAPAPQAPATRAPVTEAPVVEAPVTQAPVVEAPPATRAPAVVEPTPETPAPRPRTTPPAPAPSTTPAPAPAPSSAPASPEARQPESPTPSSTPAPRSETAAPGETTPAAAPTTTPTQPTDPSETTGPSEAQESPTSGSPTSENRSTETSESAEQTATSSVSQAARVIETAEPETLVAPKDDVAVAKTAKVVELPDPLPAPKEEVDSIARLIDLPNVPRDLPGLDRVRDAGRVDDLARRPGAWDRNVRQWRPDWVEYDDYYRPVLSNPYRDPVRIVYVYENRPRIAYIPPLSRIVLEVAQYAAYSFTAVVQGAVDTVANVAVGSFFGGGYFPGIGLPLPPPPPPLLRYDNVPVFVNYSQARYEPFRVQRIIDVGDDARFGERKVLLDGVTPAWGQWRQGAGGERQFEVHRTQQFPGLDQPSEAPLPGDYQLRLLSDEAPSSGMNRRDVYLMSAAGLCAVLSVGAVLVAMAMGRRRNV